MREDFTRDRREAKQAPWQREPRAMSEPWRYGWLAAGVANRVGEEMGGGV